MFDCNLWFQIIFIGKQIICSQPQYTYKLAAKLTFHIGMQVQLHTHTYETSGFTFDQSIIEGFRRNPNNRDGNHIHANDANDANDITVNSGAFVNISGSFHSSHTHRNIHSVYCEANHYRGMICSGVYNGSIVWKPPRKWQQIFCFLFFILSNSLTHSTTLIRPSHHIGENTKKKLHR